METNITICKYKHAVFTSYHLSVCLSISLFVCLSVCLFICSSITPSIFPPSIKPPIYLFLFPKNEEIVRAALVAITKFPLESHSIKLLPDSLLSHLNYEAEETISGSQFLSLALLLTRHNKCPMDLIVEYLLKNELGTIPRGVIYNATQKLSSVGLIDKSQRELQQFMRSYSSIEGGPSGKLM